MASPSSLELASRELEELAKRAGCRVISRSTTTGSAGSYPVLELECGDNETAIRFLNAAARHDAWHPDVRDLALRLKKKYPEPPELARAVHAFGKASLRFVREPNEVFQHTLYTLHHRGGDCDDHARCVSAIAMAGGLKARVVGVRNSRGAIGHVAPVIHDGEGWRWAETTVDAGFDEHPKAAAKRLGLTQRRDVLG
jgi:transglutaminase-like putative cysteine protease